MLVDVDVLGGDGAGLAVEVGDSLHALAHVVVLAAHNVGGEEAVQGELVVDLRVIELLAVVVVELVDGGLVALVVVGPVIYQAVDDLQEDDYLLAAVLDGLGGEKDGSRISMPVASSTLAAMV